MFPSAICRLSVPLAASIFRASIAAGSQQPRAARWLRGVALGGGRHRAGRGGAIMVRGGTGGGCRFCRGGSNVAEAAWASRRGRARCQRGNGPLERHRRHRLAPGDGARGTAAWSDIRPVASCLHADAVCGCPAGPGCDSSGHIRRRRGRYDDRHNYTGVRSTLRRPRPARVLGHGAALCGCVADCIRDAQDLDQCIRVQSDRIADGSCRRKADFVDVKRTHERPRPRYSGNPASRKPSDKMVRYSGRWNRSQSRRLERRRAGSSRRRILNRSLRPFDRRMHDLPQLCRPR